MPAIAMTGQPRDPDFAALTQKIIDIVMASCARASIVERGVQNARMPQNRKSLEHSFATMLAGSGPRARQLRRAFGRPGGRSPNIFGGVDLGDSKSVVEQALASGAFKTPAIGNRQWQLGRSAQDVADRIATWLASRPAGTVTGTVNPAQPARQAKELHLKLKRLQCVQRVGWEASDWDGNDEILCGGMGFDSTLASPPDPGGPSTAHFRKVPKFLIDKFPQDGRTYQFNPDKTFCKWDLSAGQEWPRAFLGIIALGEKDSGDEFPQVIGDIWALLSAPVIAAATSLATAGVGAALGAVIGTEFAPLIGTLVGAAVGGIVGAIVGAIADTLRDDILETSDSPVTVMLPSATDTMPGGGDTSDIYIAEYVRPSMPGRYNLSYYWQLVY